MRAIRVGQAREGRRPFIAQQLVDRPLVHGSGLAELVEFRIRVLGVSAEPAAPSSAEVEELPDPVTIQLSAETQSRSILVVPESRSGASRSSGLAGRSLFIERRTRRRWVAALR